MENRMPASQPVRRHLRSDDDVVTVLTAVLNYVKNPDRVPPNAVAAGPVIPLPVPGAWDAPKTAPTP